MALDSKHPLWEKFSVSWTTLRDAYEGEETIKSGGTLYLPPTAGHLLDGMKEGERGKANYDIYKQRARFPNYVRRAVSEMVGVMHAKPPVIELPAALEPMREQATVNTEDLTLLLRRINAEQLTTGRIGLLLDLPADDPQASLPYIASYTAESMINWDDGARERPVRQALNLVILDETEPERDADFEWTDIQKFRALILGDPTANELTGRYRQGVFRETTDFDLAQMIEPGIRGRKLDFIPFTFINASDLLPDPAPPPLIELAEICLTIYRGDADWRLNLHLQAQDTLVINSDMDRGDDPRIGAGSWLAVERGGDAKFIGVTSAGLPEQRESLAMDHAEAKQIAGQLLDQASRMKESGEALKVRVAASTATLREIALTGAAGLQKCLRQAAMWIGANPDEVIVTPNLNFAEAGMSAQQFLWLAQAKAQGLPLSDESLHALIEKEGLTEMDWAQEMDELAKERAAMLDLEPAPIEPGMTQ